MSGIRRRDKRGPQAYGHNNLMSINGRASSASVSEGNANEHQPSH